MNARYECLHCQSPIGMDDIHVAKDIALCRSCGRTMSFCEIVEEGGGSADEAGPLPKGLRFDDRSLHGRLLIYRRISPILWFMIPFTAAWSGLSMTGIYGTQLAKGEFNPGLCLFGLPFLIGTVVLVSIILFNLFGRWEFLCRNGQLEVVMRIGPVAWRRRLPLGARSSVRLRDSNTSYNNRPAKAIVVESDERQLRFGTPIPVEAQEVIVKELRRLLKGGL